MSPAAAIGTAATYSRDGYVPLLFALIDGMNVYVHLYVNDPPLSLDMVAEDFDEPAYVGYEPQPASYWSPPALQGGVAFSVCDPLYFAFVPGTAGASIQGYFATDGVDGALLWAWRRPDGAFNLGPSSSPLIIYVRLTFPPVT